MINTARTTNIRLANEAWESVLTAHSTLMRRYAKTDIWGEVSMREYDVLYTLSKSDTPLRVGEIQRGVLLSQPALSRMVDRLVTRGLLARESDPGDARATRIALTSAGAAVQQKVGRAHARDIGSTVGSSLDDDELRTLERLCRKLTAVGERR